MAVDEIRTFQTGPGKGGGRGGEERADSSIGLLTVRIYFADWKRRITESNSVILDTSLRETVADGVSFQLSPGGNYIATLGRSTAG